jgi:hypothetical protein
MTTTTTSSSLSSEDAIATRLAQDRPTIDAAIKSFLSLVAARNLTRNEDAVASMMQARSLLKAINQYTFPLLPNASEEYKITAQIWNGLIASHQKPSQFLGRMALLQAWNHGLPEEISNFQDSEFCREFETLLVSYTSQNDGKEDCDACLVWEADQGAAELARRRARRAERAQQAAKEEAKMEELPSIEEEIEELTNDTSDTTEEKATTTEANA